jgi:hypothetical protein
MNEQSKREEWTPERIQAILDATDWSEYWRRVAEDVAPKIEAYRLASAKSFARAGFHWVD